jgi:hypothetical protein
MLIISDKQPPLSISKSFFANSSALISSNVIFYDIIQVSNLFKRIWNEYYNIIGFQNNEVIESYPLAFAIKKIVGEPSINIIFEGTSLELLADLNKIAYKVDINTI